MAKLLHIESSPRESRSRSCLIANEFINTYKTINSTYKVETLNRCNTAMPDTNADEQDVMCHAKKVASEN